MTEVTEKATHGSVVVNALRKTGVAKYMKFVSGQNDSGDVEYIEALDANGLAFDLNTLTERVSYTYDNTGYKVVDGQFQVCVERKTNNSVTLQDALDHLSDNAISLSGVDWYNNEGGAGEYTLNVSTGEQRLVMSQNQATEVFWGHEIYE